MSFWQIPSSDSPRVSAEAGIAAAAETAEGGVTDGEAEIADSAGTVDCDRAAEDRGSG